MAGSDPPFDATDEPTTQPLRRPQSAQASDAGEALVAGADDAATAAAPEPSRAGTAADGRKPAGGEPARPLRQNTNWFEPGFGTEDDPHAVVTQPVEPAAQETVEPAPPEAAEPALRTDSAEGAPVENRHAAVSEPAPESARAAEDTVELPMAALQEPPHEPPAEPRHEAVELSPPVAAEPMDAHPVKPGPMDLVAAEIAAALQASEPTPAPTIPAPVAFDGARAHVAPASAPAPATISAPTYAPALYAPAPGQPERARFPDLVVRAGKVAAIAFGAWFCVVLVLIAFYRFVNPPFSSLIAVQWLGGTEIHQDWVPLESISPNLIHAVVVSEDGRFCEHWGIDFVEIAEALRRTPIGPPRGASTITMPRTCSCGRRRATCAR
jgi:monofunctional biosynthetic peptidoglycan transglycosylase